MDDIRKNDSLLKALPRASKSEIFVRFVTYFLLGLLLVCALSLSFAWFDYDRAKRESSQRDISDLRLIQFVIEQDLKNLAGDLMVLAENESLGFYLNNPNSRTLHALEQRYLNLAKDRNNYSQIRFIDREGREQVRINTSVHDSEIVPPPELQNKRDRYYFKDTFILEPGEVFVSLLDLNIEKGKVQIPFEPTLRLGTPVVDNKGEKRGIVVLNFKARAMLNRFEEVFSSRSETTFEMVNAQGYWLKAEEPGKEWGFMFNNEATIEKEKPALWAALQARNNHQLRLADGMYTFAKIFPETIIRSCIAQRRSSEHSIVDNHNSKKERTALHVWHLLLYTSDQHRSFQAFIVEHSQGPQLLFYPLIVLMLSAATLHFAIVRTNKIEQDRSLLLLSMGVEQSPAAVVITDQVGGIKYANPKFECMTGYVKDEILGENPRIFKSGKTSVAVYKDLWETILAGRVWEGDFENKRKDDKPYYVAAKIAPVFIEKGRISHLMAVMEDITENKRLQDKLEKMASFDGLTGALNRRSFLERFDKEAARARRYGSSLTILAFDLDFFKKVNDTYGHHAGDQVLVTFSKKVRADLRGSDFLGRLGGEEFCAVLVETGHKGGLVFAERLRKVIEDMEIISEEQTIRVTVSIGVAEWSETDDEIKEVLIRADRALYKAKHEGRNVVRFCEN